MVSRDRLFNYNSYGLPELFLRALENPVGIIEKPLLTKILAINPSDISYFFLYMYVYVIVVGCYCCLPLFSFPCGVPQGLVLSPTFFSSNYYYYFLFHFYSKLTFTLNEKRDDWISFKIQKPTRSATISSSILSSLISQTSTLLPARCYSCYCKRLKLTESFSFFVLFYFSLHLIYLFYSGFVSVEKVCEQEL